MTENEKRFILGLDALTRETGVAIGGDDVTLFDPGAISANCGYAFNTEDRNIAWRWIPNDKDMDSYYAGRKTTIVRPDTPTEEEPA